MRPLYRVLALLLVPALAFGAAEDYRYLKQGLDPASPASRESFTDYAPWSPTFRFLGYREEETGKLSKPDGAPLSVGEAAKLFEPYSINDSNFGSYMRSQLYAAGYRIEDDTGRVLSPKTKLPIRLIDALVLKRGMESDVKHAMLERLNLILYKEKGGGPPSPEALARARRLVKGNEKLLPQDVLAALESGETLKAGVLGKTIGDAYAASTRIYDGGRTLSSLAATAMPVLGDFNAPGRVPGYFDSEEAALGEAFAADFQKILLANEYGKILHRGLVGPAGQGKFPGFVVINTQAGDGRGFENSWATYNSANDLVQIELAAVKDALLAAVEGEDKREILEHAAGPRKFIRFLNRRPGVRLRAAGLLKAEVVHELTHAMQARRDKLPVEEGRGNSVSVIQMEKEHEAFFSSVRFFHAELLKDPESAAKNPELDGYLSALTDPDAFRENITRNYLRNWPEWAGTLSTVQDLQEERMSLARRMMGEGVYQYIFQWLKGAGQDRGLTAARKDQAAYKAWTAELFEKEIPRMREEGFAALADVWNRDERPDKELKILRLVAAKAGEGDSNLSERLDDAARRTAAWLTSPKSLEGVPAVDRAFAINYVEDYFEGKGISVPYPEGTDVPALYDAIYRATAREYLRQANLREAFHKEAYLQSAEKMLPGIADKAEIEALRKEIRRARGKAPQEAAR